MSGEGAVRTRSAATWLAAAAGTVVVLLLAAAAVLYLARLEVARRVAVAWIGRMGVEGEVRLQSLGPTGLKARVRIGPKDHPDLTVEEADVSYSLDSFLRGKGLAVSAVRLQRPVLRAAFRNGRLDLGALDRLSAALKPKPGAPPAPPPRIAIRSGVLRLDTDYGPAVVTGDADLDQGRVDRLDLALAPTTLRFGQAHAVLRGGTVKAARSGDRLRLGAQVQAASVRLDAGAAADAEFDLRADLSYAALTARRLEGRLDGLGTVREASAGDLTAAGLKFELQAPTLAAALDPGTGAGRFHLRAGAAQLRQAGLRLDRLSAEGSGAVALDKAGVKAEVAGGVSGAGASTALGAPAKDDAPVFAAVKRSLRDFHFAVPKAELSVDHGRFSGRLLAPARARSTSGGTLDLKPAGAGYVVTLAGGGLPEARADVGPIAFADGSAAARARLSAAFSLGLLDGAKVSADGRLTMRGGGLAFAASRCADVAVKRLDFGDNSAEDFSAQVCPVREPMLAVSSGGWSLAGDARDASARVPTFQVRLSQGAGSLRLHGKDKDVGAELGVDRVEVTDLAKPLRFHPVTASGRATLANDLFSGAMDVATPKGVALAHADFRDQVTAMTGGMTIHVPALTFVQGGLQPSQLSPLTAALGEPASGKVSFEGRFDWAGDKTASSGRLTVDDLSFRSPAGAVSGFSGAMAFTSLAPLKGASVGPLTAQRVAGVVPLTDVSALATVDDQTATVADGVASVGGGHVRVDAVASLSADQTVKGQVVLDKVQMHELVAQSPFSDKVSLTAEISGRLPFRMSGGKLRITDGAARADGPGRLSINRATFNPGGSKTGPATEDNLSTFGYQAMENLAFDTLDATIGSQPDGKLRMVFHVVGKHDPPTKKELRLSWRDFFDRKILNKPMPLPSNTGVNLTLDTTLNLDNLIQSQGALDRELGSATVQSSGVTIGADTSERGK
jgi:hypothetical protein